MKKCALLLALVVSGCSSIYHPKVDWTPEGYIDSQVSENQYSISFESYRVSDWNDIEGYLLLRAAEIGEMRDFAYFSVTNLKREERDQRDVIPEVNVHYTVGIEMSDPNGPGATSISHAPVGPMIPAYIKESTIRKVEGTVEFFNAKSDGFYETAGTLKKYREAFDL